MNTDRERFGRYIKRLRKSNHMTQEELSGLIDAGKNNVSKIEKGKYNVGFDTLQSIAKVFNKKIIFEDMVPEHRYEEEDLKDFLELLLRLDCIDDKKAEGITKQVISDGYRSLTDKQKYVFNQMVSDFYVDECEVCLDSISWCEMKDTFDNGGTCSYCLNKLEEAKSDR